MFKKKLTQGDIFLIVANLVPVYGVWFEGWSAVEAFIVYALETMIIGIITIMKILAVTLFRGKDDWYNEGRSQQVSGLFFIAFFILHFGLFALVQTTIFSQAAGITPRGSGMTHFFFHWYEYINRDIGIMLIAFGIGHLAKNFIPFIISGQYKTASMMLIMFQPYGRIFIQQFTVILGSMFLSLGFGKGFILVFALAKTFFEVAVDFDRIIEQSVTKMKKDSGKQ